MLTCLTDRCRLNSVGWCLGLLNLKRGAGKNVCSTISVMYVLECNGANLINHLERLYLDVQYYLSHVNPEAFFLSCYIVICQHWPFCVITQQLTDKSLVRKIELVL